MFSHSSSNQNSATQWLDVPDALSGARLTRRKAVEARLASAGGAQGEDGDGISRPPSASPAPCAGYDEVLT